MQHLLKVKEKENRSIHSIAYFLSYLDEKLLIIRVYKYLERYAYINFGVFKRITPLSSMLSRLFLMLIHLFQFLV